MSSEFSDGWTIGTGAGVLVAEGCDSVTSRESCVRCVTGEDVVASGTSSSASDTSMMGAKIVHLWSSSEVEVVLAVFAVMAALAAVTVLLLCHALDSNSGQPCVFSSSPAAGATYHPTAIL
jgi:hypothetical protein